MKRARKFSVVTAPPLSAFACPRGYGECENARECVYPGRCHQPRTMDEKLAAAVAFLGERWCLHPKFDRKRLRVGLLNTWRDSLPRYRPNS